MKDHAYRNRGGRPEPVLYRAYAQIPNMSTQPRPLIIHVRTDQPAEASLGVDSQSDGERSIRMVPRSSNRCATPRARKS